MTSWCRASAVRFIGSHRPSCTIDHDVSTHNATAARARCSVSPSRRRRRPADRPPREAAQHGVPHRPGARPTARCRRTAQGRHRPVGSPAAPAQAVSRSPARRSWSTTPRSAVSPSRRNALGVSRKEPSGARSSRPCCRSSAPGRPGGGRRRPPRGRAGVPAPRGRCPPAGRRGRTGPAARPARPARPRSCHRLRALAEAQRVLAAEPGRGGPVLAGPQRCSRSASSVRPAGRAEVAERLLDQLGQFGALLRRSSSSSCVARRPTAAPARRPARRRCAGSPGRTRRVCA